MTDDLISKKDSHFDPHGIIHLLSGPRSILFDNTETRNNFKNLDRNTLAKTIEGVNTKILGLTHPVDYSKEDDKHFAPTDGNYVSMETININVKNGITSSTKDSPLYSSVLPSVENHSKAASADSCHHKESALDSAIIHNFE